MTGAPAKRQKREEFRKKIAQATTPTTDSGDGTPSPTTVLLELPRKKYYRQRAHANVFSDHLLKYPLSPAHMNWSTHFPAFVNPDPTQTTLKGDRKLLKDVEVVDIGCGFGGLLVGLAPVLPDTLMVGMEIRAQVTEYLTSRIKALRSQQQHLKATNSSTATSSTPPAPSPAPVDTTEDSPAASTIAPPSTTETITTLIPGGYQNISALRANTMKFFPNFFARGQLSKIFICFPDPHFKARKHKARIITKSLNAEYAYALRPGGLLYTITDVEEYHFWILRHFAKQRETVDTDADADVDMDGEGEGVGSEELFDRLTEEELERDECVQVMRESTEEGKKVTRNKGNKYVAVFRRREDPEWA